jgi:hypothetical protein
MRKFDELRLYLHDLFVPLAFLFVLFAPWNLPV